MGCLSGSYFEDKKDGEGVFKWGDGREYRGQWKNGKQHGKGTLVDKDGNMTVAEWIEGKRVRPQVREKENND